jgi:hypothetical protein
MDEKLLTQVLGSLLFNIFLRHLFPQPLSKSQKADPTESHMVSAP